jgi:hypothetical protein
MRAYRRLIAVIATLLALTGPVGATDQAFNLGTLTPSVTQQTDFYGATSVAIPYSFNDLFNFTVGADYRTVLASAVSYAPEGTSAGAAHSSDLTLTLYAGADGTGSVLGTISSSEGSMIDLSAALDPGLFSARVTGIADGQAGGGFLFSVAAVPEPAEWMMLVCGLLAIGYMARRRTSWATA